MNMFKPIKAKSMKEYIAAVPADRKEIITFLHAFIQKAASRLKPHFAYNMLGYGSFPYKNYKNEVISWPIVALATVDGISRKLEANFKTISQHTKTLVQAGLLNKKCIGRQVAHSLAPFGKLFLEFMRKF